MKRVFTTTFALMLSSVLAEEEMNEEQLKAELAKAKAEIERLEKENIKFGLLTPEEMAANRERAANRTPEEKAEYLKRKAEREAAAKAEAGGS